MKIAAFTLVLGTAAAFAPAQDARIERTAALYAEQSRKAFLAQAAGLSASLLAAPLPAFAAKYGSIGAGSSAVLDPNEAEIDDDVLKSSAVQGALEKVKGYQSTVQKMKAALDSDDQANLKSYIVKELDFANLRNNLNVLNSAFEEDTQRGTDRLIRAILQDITELETANAQKDGVPRSPRRLEIMQGKLAKLDKAFGDYLAFAK
mmetsp:Transcript_18786/g.35658  ORF Transcript_18786/g.35658 Transcript_18786/m.35658 type:complete len:205 (+) Transcript_18786:119-733(+)